MGKQAPVLFLVTFLLTHLALANLPRRAVQALRISEPIQVDGLLKEKVWGDATPAIDFIQSEPREGEPASEETRVYVLYDERNLYIGAVLEDNEPEGIIARELRRDFQSGSSGSGGPVFQDDVFMVMLDSFGDGRNGFLFATNPLGARLDGQITGESGFNLNWDGVWFAGSTVHGKGWSCEIVIPFKTLRYKSHDNQTWRVNFGRFIRRKSEEAYWSPIPRQFNIFRIFLAGNLVGLEGLPKGKSVGIKPFTLASLNNGRLETDAGYQGSVSSGLDVKYGLTPALNLDLTLNTDFSHVEVDEEQINLTRVSLLFPEKREFFLENGGLFSFPIGLGGQDLFFSRRIGLSGNSTAPLLGGARLTGRSGSYNLGLMNIQSRQHEHLPPENFSAVRVTRDMFSRSRIGGMFLNRHSGSVSDGHYSLGLDADLRPLEDLVVRTFVAKTSNPGLEGDDVAYEGVVTRRGTFFRFYVSHLEIGRNFQPEMGFILRRNVEHSFGQFLLAARPNISFIRQVTPDLILDYVKNKDTGPESKRVRASLAVRFEDGSNLRFYSSREFERLSGPVTLFQVALPPDDYLFRQTGVQYQSDPSDRFSGRIGFEAGDFYDGRKRSYDIQTRYQGEGNLSLALRFVQHDLVLMGRELSTRLVGMRMNYSFTTSLFLSSFIQYNSSTRQTISNFRLNFIHRPLSDFYLVFTERRELNGRADRGIAMKFTYLFQM